MPEILFQDRYDGKKASNAPHNPLFSAHVISGSEILCIFLVGDGGSDAIVGKDGPDGLEHFLQKYRAEWEGKLIIDLSNLRNPCSTLFGTLGEIYDLEPEQTLFSLPQDPARKILARDKLRACPVDGGNIKPGFVLTLRTLGVDPATEKVLLEKLHEVTPKILIDPGLIIEGLDITGLEVMCSNMGYDHITQEVVTLFHRIIGFYNDGLFLFEPDTILLLTVEHCKTALHEHLKRIVTKYHWFADPLERGKLSRADLPYIGAENFGNSKGHGYDLKSSGIFLVKDFVENGYAYVEFLDFGESSKTKYSGGKGLGIETILAPLRPFGVKVETETGIYLPNDPDQRAYGERLLAKAREVKIALLGSPAGILPLGTGYRITLRFPLIHSPLA